MKETVCNKSFSWKEMRFVRSVSVFLLGVVIAGCSPNQETPPSATPNKVVIKGSNTVGEELAPRLIAEYKKEHPQVSIELETKGSGSGFWGLIADVCDIAAASRTMVKEEQEQAQVHGMQLEDNIIGSYSVAVIVNAGNPVGDLTREQARGLFTGTIQNWKEVGGPDAPVHLFIRDPVSGTYLGFRELAMEDKPYATNTTALTNYAGIVEAVARDASGIGYASLQSAAKSGVKAVSIGGVPAAAPAVKEGKYPFARVLHLFTKKASETPLTHDFIEFVQSSRGQAILDQMGLVPNK